MRKKNYHKVIIKIRNLFRLRKRRRSPNDIKVHRTLSKIINYPNKRISRSGIDRYYIIAEELGLDLILESTRAEVIGVNNIYPVLVDDVKVYLELIELVKAEIKKEHRELEARIKKEKMTIIDVIDIKIEENY